MHTIHELAAAAMLPGRALEFFSRPSRILLWACQFCSRVLILLIICPIWLSSNYYFPIMQEVHDGNTESAAFEAAVAIAKSLDTVHRLARNTGNLTRYESTTELAS